MKTAFQWVILPPLHSHGTVTIMLVPWKSSVESYSSSRTSQSNHTSFPSYLLLLLFSKFTMHCLGFASFWLAIVIKMMRWKGDGKYMVDILCMEFRTHALNMELVKQTFFLFMLYLVLVSWYTNVHPVCDSLRVVAYEFTKQTCFLFMLRFGKLVFVMNVHAVFVLCGLLCVVAY